MVSRSFSYPVPVVGWGDDVAGEVKGYSLDHHLHENALVLSIKGLEVTNATLAALLSAGIFGWCIRVHCRTTYFRRSWLVDGPDVTVSIPLSEISQALDLSVEVVCRQAQPRYLPQGLHPDFGNASFQLKVGDVVAIGPTAELHVDLGFDPLKGEVASIMLVDQSPTRESGAFEVNFDGPKITILIPKLQWQAYKDVKNVAATSVHAGLVFPVLVEAVSLVRDAERGGTYADHLWFQRVRAWLDALNLDTNQPLDAAQELLQQPFGRMLADMSKLVSPESES